MHLRVAGTYIQYIHFQLQSTMWFIKILFNRVGDFGETLISSGRHWDTQFDHQVPWASLMLQGCIKCPCFLKGM